MKTSSSMSSPLMDDLDLSAVSTGIRDPYQYPPYFNQPPEVMQFGYLKNERHHSDQRSSFSSDNRISGDGYRDMYDSATNGPIKLKNVRNIDVKFVPSPEFLAHIKKRSGNRKK